MTLTECLSELAAAEGCMQNLSPEILLKVKLRALPGIMGCRGKDVNHGTGHFLFYAETDTKDKNCLKSCNASLLFKTSKPCIFNRPGEDGAVLQTTVQLIK